MHVLVLRHGCAGEKREWSGPDAERPLDAAGIEQAEALVGALVSRPVRRIVSSPTARCLETVVPLARARGLGAEQDRRLGREASGEQLLALAAKPDFEDAVLCTHGEVMTGALQALRDAAVPIAAAAPGDDARLLAKGTGWDLTVVDGEVTHMRHVDPSPDLACATHPPGRHG